MNTIELTAAEKSLKDLLEDRSVGDSRRVQFAEMTKRAYGELKDVSYDELIQLHNEAVEVLKVTSPMDISYEYFLKQRDILLKMATAVNDAENMGRHDHLMPVHALVSVRNVTVESEFWIPKLNYRASERDNIIRSEIIRRMNDSSTWTPSMRHRADIDFVEV